MYLLIACIHIHVTYDYIRKEICMHAPMHVDSLRVAPQELAEEERQFHTVTDIVTKHREGATNKSLGTVEGAGFGRSDN